jgi:hypothetical protein
MNKLLLLTVLASLSLLVCLQAQAAVITFDDLGVLDGAQLYPIPNGYAGVTWGDAPDAFNPGSFGAIDKDAYGGYTIPHSGECAAFNGYQEDARWFDFGAPVTFNGAWFATAPGSGIPTAKVMLSSNLGDTTSWLTLTAAPQYLGADWAGVTRITVNRDPVGWFAMDDVTYNEAVDAHGSPELSTWMLLGCSGLAGLVLRRRRKA